MANVKGGNGCCSGAEPPSGWPKRRGSLFQRNQRWMWRKLFLIPMAWKKLNLPLMPLIRFYRAFQFLIPRSMRGKCRMEPTCSVYARDTVRQYGTVAAWPLIMAYLSLCCCDDAGQKWQP